MAEPQSSTQLPKDGHMSIRQNEEPTSAALPRKSTTRKSVMSSDSEQSQEGLVTETLDEIRMSVNKVIKKHASMKARRD